MKRWLHILLQVVFLSLFVPLGEGLARLLHTHIPGSILGMILLFLLLQCKWIRIEWVEAGAGWLLGEMLLFFVPPAVGIVQYENILAADGWRIFAVIALSTSIVMLSAGLCAEFIYRQRKGSQHEHSLGQR